MAEKRQEVYSQVVPLAGSDALLPNTSIAEIIPYLAPKSVANAPAWLLGLLPWRGLDIPLISVEAATGSKLAPPGKTSRIAVINAVNGQANFHFFAFLTQGIPRLIKVTGANLEAAAASDKGKNISSKALLAGEHVIIPDVESLGAMIIQSGKFSKQ